MQILQLLWDTINGKKTYLVCLATLVFAGLGFVLDYLDKAQATQLVALALTGMGLRHGMPTK